MRTLVCTSLLICTMLISSCEKQPPTVVIGSWQLVAYLADPGDGSGQFVAVDSDKRLEFHEDGTVTSNGPLCMMGADAQTPSSGTYSDTDSTITVSDCNGGASVILFTMQGGNLILMYPCIEACREKFVAID